MSSFGETIKKLRKGMNMTQVQVAEHIGLSIRVYQYYEAGKINPPHEKLMKLSELFDVSTDYLLFGSDVVLHGKVKAQFHIDEILYEQLKVLSEAEMRTINTQVEYIIKKAVEQYEAQNGVIRSEGLNVIYARYDLADDRGG